MKIFWTVLWVAVGLVALFFYLESPRIFRRVRDGNLRRPYAHRGLWTENAPGGIPENSLAAYRRAVKAGYGIELDVQKSADGTIYVFHDYTLTRMCGDDRKLTDLHDAQIESFRLVGTEEKIPTLDEVLTVVDGQVPILVELKGESFDTGLCDPLAARMKRYGGSYCVESFNPLLIHRYGKLCPDIFRGMLVTNLLKGDQKGNFLFHLSLTMMLLNVLARPDFIAYDGRFRLPSVMLATRLFRAARFCWTIDSEEGMRVCAREKAQPIFQHIVPENFRKPENRDGGAL